MECKRIPPYAALKAYRIPSKADPWSAPRGRQVMELLSKIAHEQNGAVIVVTHDHRALDVFDHICEMEDGMIRLRPSG